MVLPSEQHTYVYVLGEKELRVETTTSRVVLQMIYHWAIGDLWQARSFNYIRGDNSCILLLRKSVRCVTNKLLLRKTKIHPQNNMHFKLSWRTERENGRLELMFSSFSSLGALRLWMALFASTGMALIRRFLPDILQHKIRAGQCRSCINICYCRLVGPCGQKLWPRSQFFTIRTDP